MKKRALVYFLIFFMLSNLLLPMEAGAIGKLPTDEIELYLKITCRADIKFSDKTVNEDGTYTQTESNDSFTAILEGTSRYEAQKGLLSDSGNFLFQVENKFKAGGYGSGGSNSSGTVELETFGDKGWEKKKFPQSFNGSWSYKLPTEEAEAAVVDRIEIIPQKGKNPKYSFYLIASHIIPYIEEKVIVDGSWTSKGENFEGTYTDSQPYDSDYPPGSAPMESMFAYDLMWEEDDEETFEGELKPEGKKYTASGSRSHNFTTEDGNNLRVDIYYEINRKPVPKEIQVNQALGRYEYTNKDEYVPCEDFISGKDTAIQVFFPDNTSADDINGIELDVYRDGGKIATLKTFTRDMNNNSVIFIPKSRREAGSWAAGLYKFEAKIGDKVLTLDNVRFMESSELNILAVPVKANYGGEIVSPGNQWKKGYEFLKKVYPIAYDKVSWNIGGPVDASDSKYDLTTKQGRDNLLKKLDGRQRQSGKPYDIIIGFIENGIKVPGGWLQGYTKTGPSNVVVNSDQDMQATVAHEIAHLYKVGDEYIGGDFNFDVNEPPYGYTGYDWHDGSKRVAGMNEDVVPFPDGDGSTIDADLHPLDIGERKLRGDSISFMGSGADMKDNWITPDIWEHLYYTLGPVTYGPDGANKTAAKITPSDYEDDRVVIISGNINKSGEIEMSYPFINYRATVENAYDSEEYAVNVVDENGDVIGSQGFNPIYNVQTDPPQKLESPVFDNVPVYVPSGAAALQIVKGDDVLKEIGISGHTPKIDISSPSKGDRCSGEVNIKWDGTDEDGDELYYTVEYSADGMEWDVLDWGVTGNSLAYDFNSLAGSDNGKIRVTASDGINTSYDIVQGLKVPYVAPEVFIDEPSILHDAVILRGSAYDLGDGWLLDEDNLEWSSDRDGSLGGSSLLFLNNLSSGKHVITLKATNSSGQASSGSITIDTESIPTEFGFEIKVPSVINPGTDVKADVNLKAVTPGDTGYTGVSIAFKAEGPGDVIIKAPENGRLQPFTNEGTIGGGLDIPKGYNKTEQFILNFSKAGAYRLEFYLVDGEGKIIDSVTGYKTFEVTEKVGFFSRVRAWWRGLWDGFKQWVGKIRSIIQAIKNFTDIFKK